MTPIEALLERLSTMPKNLVPCPALHPTNSSLQCIGRQNHTNNHWYDEIDDTPLACEWNDEGRVW